MPNDSKNTWQQKDIRECNENIYISLRTKLVGKINANFASFPTNIIIRVFFIIDNTIYKWRHFEYPATFESRLVYFRLCQLNLFVYSHMVPFFNQLHITLFTFLYTGLENRFWSAILKFVFNWSVRINGQILPFQLGIDRPEMCLNPIIHSSTMKWTIKQKMSRQVDLVQSKAKGLTRKINGKTK